MKVKGLFDYTESDKRYFERQRQRDIKHKEALKKMHARGDASIEWHKLHPEGITKDNLQEFKNYIKSNS